MDLNARITFLINSSFIIFRAYGDSKHLRKLFPRALQSTRDWPESIVEEWLHFERVEGTLDSYEEALFKCRSR